MSPSLDEEKRATAAKLVKELSPQELRVWQDATFRMLFIKNALALSGFIGGAVPFFLTRRGRWRLKAAASGTMGYLCFGSVGWIIGANEAMKVIKSYPNHEHLVQVIKEQMPLLRDGRLAAASTSSPSGQNRRSDTPVSDRVREMYPHSSNENQDDDSLLSDDEINRRYQEVTSTPPKQAAQEKPSRSSSGSSPPSASSAWDEVRARAAKQQGAPQEKKEENEEDIWK